MDYIYEEGTIARELEEGLYEMAFRSENLFRIRERLERENLVSEDEAIVLESVQSIMIALILKDAMSIDLLDRIMEYIHELEKTRK